MGMLQNLLSTFRKNAPDKVVSEKQKIRSEVRIKKSALSEEDRQEAAKIVFERVEASDAFKDSNIVLLYWSLPDELPTHEFIDKWSGSKMILLPVVNNGLLEIRRYTSRENLSKGPYGISEPIDNSEYKDKIDLAIVPGVAFDCENRRIGRGKGYYDRFLANRGVYKIGVGFDFQLYKNLPGAAFDIKMNKVITPSHCP